MRRLLLPALLALAVAGISGCAATGNAVPSTTPPTTFTASGTVDVTLDVQDAMKASGGPSQGQPCEAGSKYRDVTTSKVEITDATGATVALGEMQSGTLQPQKDNTMVLFARCRLSFTVADVPSGKFFGVHVGDSSRELQKFSRSELENGVAIVLPQPSDINR